MRLRWIVVDGIDGSGKNTIGKMIRDHYAGMGERVYMVAHPSERYFGRASRRALQGRGRLMRILAAFFFILDVLASLRVLKSLGGEYQTIIFVRYLMGTAYLPQKLAQTGYDFFRKLLPVPQRLLLVDIDPKEALKRIAKRNEHREMFEDLDSLVSVRKKILLLAGDEWEIMDNSGPEEASREKVIQILNRWNLR